MWYSASSPASAILRYMGLCCLVVGGLCVGERAGVAEMIPFAAGQYSRDTVASELDQLRAELASSASTARSTSDFDWTEDSIASVGAEQGTEREIPWRRTDLGWENSATWDIQPRPATTTDLATAVHPLLVGLMALLLSLAALVAFDDSVWRAQAHSARR